MELKEAIRRLEELKNYCLEYSDDQDVKALDIAINILGNISNTKESRTIVSDEEILGLIKSGTNTWVELLNKTGYESMEHLRRRVRRMHYKGMVVMGNNYNRFDVKVL